MKRLPLVGLGARLATAGGTQAWVRLGLIAVGFALGSGLMLLATSIPSGVHAQDVRRDMIHSVTIAQHAPGSLHVWNESQSFGDVDIQVGVVTARGKAPVPPGLPRVPNPGEMFVSERLASMWAGIGPAIEHRLRGHLAGTIGREGLTGPDELKIWAGKPQGVDLRPRDGIRTYGFITQTQAEPGNPFSLAAFLAALVAASVVVLPIWLFVATVTRLSAATREARLAAVRLAGATESQLRFLASIETGVAAALGSIIGFPLYIALRPVLANGVIGGLQLWPADLTPPTALIVAILLGLPTLAVVMSSATMRRVVVSPLGVARHVRTNHAGWRWLVVLAGGIGLLAWCASQHAMLKRSGAASAILISGSLVAIGFGLLGSAAWSTWLLARRLTRSALPVGFLLGFRRLESEPGSVSRVVGGVALMIALMGVLQSGMLGLERSQWAHPVLPVEATAMAPNDILVSEAVAGTSTIDLSDIPGIKSVRWTRKLPHMEFALPVGLISTDGSAATLEAIRERLAWSGADIHSLPQIRARALAANDDYRSIRRAGLGITLFLLLVSAATVFVGMVDWLMERRRSLAMLSAIGAGTGVIRRSVLAQVALPLSTSLIAGLTGAILITELVYRAAEQPVVIATRQLTSLIIAVIVIVVLATAASAPWLRISRRPELLRES